MKDEWRKQAAEVLLRSTEERPRDDLRQEVNCDLSVMRQPSNTSGNFGNESEAIRELCVAVGRDAATLLAQ
jgi:hypothetical protein